MSLLFMLTPGGAPAEPKPEAPNPLADLLGVEKDFWEKKSSAERTWGRGPSNSSELERILALPRREKPDLETIRHELTGRLGKGKVQCACKSHYHRPCPDTLRPVQAWALHEAPQAGGLLGPIGVGEGKTLLDLLMPMVMPECRVAILLLPARLRDRLIESDWAFYEQHWHLPNLVGSKWVDPKKPFLHVVSFDELSREKSTELLIQRNPDLLVVDEGHKLSSRKSTRTKRFISYARKNPKVRLCVWSGTLMKREIQDCAHLSAIALKENSPIPTRYEVLEEWGTVLNPCNDFPTPAGALEKLCKPGETPLEGFLRRMRDTLGVVSSTEGINCPASLNFYERKIGVPDELKKPLADLESLWIRPDKEELITALEKWKVANELASGFFYKWVYPRGEDPQLIDAWFEARQAFNRELREKLKHTRPHLDSPFLCRKAAIRFYEGYQGPLPTWDAESWPAWHAVHKKVRPDTKTVWVSDYLVRDAAAWLEELQKRKEGPRTGIVWYDHRAFGEALHQLTGLPIYRGQSDGGREPEKEDGSRSIICSIEAYGTGQNLQYAFSENLVPNPPSDGAAWEQLIGRTHRPGQERDEVNFYVYRHLEVLANALDKARELAAFIGGGDSGEQRLQRATYYF